MRTQSGFGILVVAALLLVGCSRESGHGDQIDLRFGREVATFEPLTSTRNGERCLQSKAVEGQAPARNCFLERELRDVGIDVLFSSRGFTIGVVSDAALTSGYTVRLVWNGGKATIPVNPDGTFAVQMPSDLGQRDIVLLNGDRVVAGCTYSPIAYVCGRADGGS